MMNTRQNNKISQMLKSFYSGRMIVCLFLFLQIHSAWADALTIKNLDFAALAGDKVQLQLEMDGAAVEPKVFQTDNPARIALDFAGVKNGLNKKSFVINKGAASSVYVVEAEGRTRVVINLVQAVPYHASVEGNKILVTLSEATPALTEEKQNIKVEAVPEAELETVPEKVQPTKPRKPSVIAKLMPKQTVKDIDFRRGSAGNGLLLVALAKPNTIVDVKESGGKVVLRFLNTQLPEKFRKRFDVSDFATPVQKVDAVSVGNDTVLTVATVDGNYEYSSYQANGLLTVDFKPLTPEEKEEAAKKKFPYTGNKLSLNFQDIDVRVVLQVLADFTDFNMVASDAVGGQLTLRLNDVPWDQALDLILKSKGLGQRKAGNVVWIAPMSEITKLEKEEEESQKVSVRLEPLKTEYIQINYAKAEDIKMMLMGQGTSATGSTPGAASASGVPGFDTGRLLSDRGVANVDPRTNTLIVKDTVGRLDEIRGLIKLLDIPVRQVMIESRIVIASKNFAQDLGVKFGVAKGADLGGGQSFFLTGKDTKANAVNIMNGTNPKIELPNSASNLVDLGATAVNNHPVGALAMTLAKAADYMLNLELSALQGENKGEVLANPRVMTSDRVKASIKQGVQIPYVTQGQGGASSTTWKEAILQLEVTPQITPNGSIIMDLNISKNNPAADGTGSVEQREVKTTVQINDGETVVLGGVYEYDTGIDTAKVPFFGDLPGIGILFKKKQESDRKRELLVFVTPKIVKDTLSVH